MAAKITTISLSQQDIDLIEQYSLSPTALIKEKLGEFRTIFTSAAIKIRELNSKIERLQDNVRQLMGFISDNGLWEKYLDMNLKANVVEKGEN